MKSIPHPIFREGIEWRKLSKEERAGKAWKYILLADVFISVETGVQFHFDCISSGKVWLQILPHGLIISKGYSWNGNTFSPDNIGGVSLLLPSLAHDPLFQFSGAVGFPRKQITLPWTNWLYLQLSHWFLGRVYHAGLVAGSWLLWGETLPGDYVMKRPLHKPEPT